MCFAYDLNFGRCLECKQGDLPRYLLGRLFAWWCDGEKFTNLSYLPWTLLDFGHHYSRLGHYSTLDTIRLWTLLTLDATTVVLDFKQLYFINATWNEFLGCAEWLQCLIHLHWSPIGNRSTFNLSWHIYLAFVLPYTFRASRFHRLIRKTQLCINLVKIA